MIYWIPVKRLKEKTEIPANQEYIHDHVCAPIQPSEYFILIYALSTSVSCFHTYIMQKLHIWTGLVCSSCWINCMGHHNKTHTFLSLKHAVSLYSYFGLSYTYKNAKISFERNDHMFTSLCHHLLRKWTAKLPLSLATHGCSLQSVFLTDFQEIEV